MPRTSGDRWLSDQREKLGSTHSLTTRNVRNLCLSTANRCEDEEKERAAQLPEPSGLDDAARQDALAVADDLFGFELRDVAGAHLEPAGHHLVGMLP